MPDPQVNSEEMEKLKNLSIQRIIEGYPWILPVLYNHLGASCFDCPGRFEETLAKGVILHEADSVRFYEDLERVLKSELADGDLPERLECG